MPTAGADGLTILDLSRRFGAKPAVEAVSLHVRRGEVVALFGPNGAGKTTLLRAAAGLSAPDAGRVLVDGLDMAVGPSEAKRKVGWAADTPLLYDDLTATENLVFFGRLWGLAPEEARTAASEALAGAGLAHRAADPARELSHGMRQRLSLARAMLHRPAVLLLDEPFEGLDASASAALIESLRDADGRAARACLLATHNIGAGWEACDRVAVMDSGRLLRVAPRSEVDPRALAEELRKMGGAGPHG